MVVILEANWLSVIGGLSWTAMDTCDLHMIRLRSLSTERTSGLRLRYVILMFRDLDLFFFACVTFYVEMPM